MIPIPNFTFAAAQPNATTSMDTSSAKPQQPFPSFFGNGSPAPLGNATATNAAKNTWPAFNWSLNSNTNPTTNASIPTNFTFSSPAPVTTTAVTPAASPFAFPNTTTNAATPALTPFKFQAPQPTAQPNFFSNNNAFVPTASQQTPSPQSGQSLNDFIPILQQLQQQTQMLQYQNNQMREQLNQFMLNGGYHCAPFPINSFIGAGNYYPQYPGARMSSLALDYLQMSMNDKHQQDYNDQQKKKDTHRLWRANDCSSRIPMSKESVLHMPTRHWESTSLADPYREQHHLQTPYSRQNWRQKTQAMDRGYRGSSYCDRVRGPSRSRFRLDTAATDWENLYKSTPAPTYVWNNKVYGANRDGSYPPSQSLCEEERDRRWKVLNQKVVNGTDDSNGKPIFPKNNRQTSLWEDDTHYKSYAAEENLTPRKNWLEEHTATRTNTGNRNREPQNVWNFLHPAKLSLGPPLKTHFDEEDVNFFDALKSGLKHKPDLVANLPIRFKCKPSHHVIMPTRTSTAKSQAIKEEVNEIYKNWQSGCNPQLDEKTSQVFFTGWKSLAQSNVNQESKNKYGISVEIKSQTPASLSTSISEHSSTQTDEDLGDEKHYFGPRFVTTNSEPSIKNLFQRQPGRPHRNQVTDAMLEVAEIISQSSLEDELLQEIGRVCKVKLTKKGYYCRPDLNSLDPLTSKNGESCMVSNFEVGHSEHGNVMFPGYTNVFGLDLDKIVWFNDRTLELFPNENDRPRFGEGLHKPCIVTLLNIWPKAPQRMASDNNVPSNVIKNPETVIQLEFELYLQKLCSKFRGKFVNYCPEHGKWKFMIQLLPP